MTRLFKEPNALKGTHHEGNYTRQSYMCTHTIVCITYITLKYTVHVYNEKLL